MFTSWKKMCGFWLFFYLFFLNVVLEPSSSESDFFVAKKTNEVTCVTNGSSAIVWVHSDIKSFPLKQQVSEFIPKGSVNYFDCEIHTDDHNCHSYWILDRWSLTNSIKYGFSDVVLDRRWENFYEYRTEPAYGRSRLVFNRVASFSKNNFELTLSIRIKQEAHIFLCDKDTSPVNSNCYWLLMHAFSNTGTALRKCQSEQISPTNNLFPDNSCYNNIYRKNHSEPGDYYLTKKSWRHFRIEMHATGLRVNRIDKNEKVVQRIFDFTDEKILDVKHVFIHSKTVPGLWRVHDYYFISTNQIIQDAPIGAYFAYSETSVCISMFLRMCSSCLIKFQLLMSSQLNGYKYSQEKILQQRSSSNETLEILNLNVFRNANDKRFDRYYTVAKSIIRNFAKSLNRLASGVQEYGLRKVYVTYPSQSYVYVKLRSFSRIGPQKTSWTEIQLNFDGLTDYEGLQLTVSTSRLAGEGDSFWAIDSPRLCQNNEFRRLRQYTADTGLRCQLVSADDNAISLQDSHNNVTGVSCPDPTSISRMCVPCNIVLKDCIKQSGIKVCEEENGRTECFCSAGYEGINCEKRCAGGNFYGQYCAKPCGKCSGTFCNNVDGKCDSRKCMQDFTGDRCDQPPGLILENPPEIDSVGHTSVKVRVSNFNLMEMTSSQDTSSILYELQYKVDSSSVNSQKWISAQRKTFGDSSPTTIPNLKSDTAYEVRAVLLITEEKYSYMGDYVPSAKFKTTCEGLGSEDIIINPITNITATFIIEITESTCTMDTCEVSVLPEGAITIAGSKYYILGLTPFTDYEIRLKCANSTSIKPFSTLEGSPSEVVDFTITNQKPSSVELNWGKPEVTYGNIKYYNIYYEHKKYLGCPDSPTVEKSSRGCINVTGTSTLVPDLIPYSEYEFTVTAYTTMSGKPVTESSETSFLETLEEKEHVVVEQINQEATYALISFNQIKCQDIRGPISVQMKLRCLAEWCKNESSTVIFYQRNLPLTKLFPYTEYELYVNTCRNETSPCRDSPQRETFKTKPSEPYQITELAVYSKGDSEISIRWRPPYPPTGELQEFLIKYYYYRYGKKENPLKAFKNDTCKIWPEYYCKTIDGLSTDYTHYISVSARNEEPNKFGTDSKPITVTTNEEAPEAPYDLETIWSESNQLNISWKHPNNTNGKLTKFSIEIQNQQGMSSEDLNMDESKYNLTYVYQVRSQIEPSESYMISVRAYNKFMGAAVTKQDTSPPSIPVLAESPKIVASSNSTLTFHLPAVNFTKKNLESSFLYLVLSSDNDGKNGGMDQEVLSKINLSNGQVLDEINLLRSSRVLMSDYTIGDDTEDSKNPPLVKNRNYTITVALVNVYKNKTRVKKYSLQYIIPDDGTGDDSEGDSSLWALVLLLAVIPIAVFGFLKRDQIRENAAKFKTLITEQGGQAVKAEEDHIPLAKSNSTMSTKDVGISMKNITNGKSILVIGKTKATEPTPKKNSRPVKITEFEQYVRESIENKELERQHGLFPRGQTKPWSYGELKVNKSKNRYNNLIAYDHTRVVLEKIKGDPHSDYINANYIDKKVEQYWPEINESLQFGSIEIRYLSSSVFADFEYRTFSVTNDDTARKVHQLHFTTWPDHGVPLYSQSLVPFLRRILQMPISTKSPLVIHCSAGVGRTGTVILCDISLRMAAGEGHIDMLNTLETIRSQRANMVDNPEQYKLAHLVVLECLIGMSTSIPCNDIENGLKKLKENDGVRLQMRYLKDTSWQDQAMKTVGEPDGQVPVYHEKNRYPDIVPEIQGRIFLNCRPSGDEQSSYINAVNVDGFRWPGRFIVTQQPMPNTLGDFWRLVEENNISLIVSLQEIDPNDKTSCEFWPSSKNSTMKPVDYISLEVRNEKTFEGYNVTTVVMNVKEDSEIRNVEIISLKNWHPKQDVPASADDFLSFWEAAEALSRKSEKIVVTCHDGANACGVYVALSFIIEKMKLEQICDVCQAVRKVRHNRPQFVNKEEQFTFLYEAAVKYINGFYTYANFN